MKRLDGVRSQKLLPDTKWTIELTVSESRSILPSKLQRAMPAAGDYVGARIDLVGSVTRKGSLWLLTARGSGQIYVLTPNDALTEIPDEKRKRVRIAGELTEEGPKGRFPKGTALIEVSSASVVDPAPKE